MSMGRARFLAVVSVLAAGCASGEDVEFSSSTDASPRRDTAVSPAEDTAPGPLDTGSPKDTAVDPPDTAVTVDTGTGPADTGVGPTDSSVVDSSSLDSSTLDSGAVDSAVLDSAVVDSSAIDSFVMDTAVADTEVADTAIADTAITDTGAPTTVRLATGTYGVYGVTTDGYVVYGDAAKTMYAVSLAGGAPQTIGASISRVRVSNKAVFAWGTVDANGFAPLTVWTAANGAKSLALKSLAPSTTASYAAWVAAASADGTWAMFTDGGVGGVSDKADVKIAKTDGTGVKTIFTQYVVYDGSILTSLNDFCAPLMGWAGTRFVTSHCTPSGTSVSFDASSVDPTVGTATTLGTNLGAYWTANDAGTQVALVTSAGSLRLLPIAGGLATVIDSGVASAQFTHDGTYLVYRTSANALKRSPTSVATPSTLISSGVVTVLTGVSPSDKHLLYSSSTTTGAYNVRLASTTAAGTGTSLYATAAAEIYGDAFTADSTHALYFQSVSADVGTLVAHPVGGSAITLGTSAWIDLAATGGKVVWSDGYSSLTGRATIRTRDMAGLTGTIVTIAANADANFFLSPAKDQVVYSLSGGTASDGVWATPIP